MLHMLLGQGIQPGPGSDRRGMTLLLVPPEGALPGPWPPSSTVLAAVLASHCPPRPPKIPSHCYNVGPGLGRGKVWRLWPQERRTFLHPLHRAMVMWRWRWHPPEVRLSHPSLQTVFTVGLGPRCGAPREPSAQLPGPHHAPGPTAPGCSALLLYLS